MLYFFFYQNSLIIIYVLLTLFYFIFCILTQSLKISKFSQEKFIKKVCDKKCAIE